MKSAGRILRPFLLVALCLVVLSWVIPNWPRIVEFFSILRMFALLAVCLPVGTAVTLFVFWFLKKRFGLRVLQLSGPKKRLGISLVLTFVVVLSGAVVELIGYEVATAFYAVEGDRIGTFSITRDTIVLTMSLLIFIDIVFVVSVLLESTRNAWRKRWIFLFGSAVFMIVVNIALTRLELLNSFWFENLSRLSKVIPPPTKDVALFDFSFGWPGKREFLSTLSILARERPRAVVLLFPLDMHMSIDSSSMLELRRAVPVERLVIDADSRQRGYLPESIPAELTLVPNPLLENRFPMSIRLIPWRHSLGDDYAIATLKVLERTEKQSVRPEADKSRLRIGRFNIPMSWDSRMPIKYYATTLLNLENAVQPFFALRYVHFPSSDQAYISQIGGSLLASVNHERQRLEYTPTITRGTPPNVFYDYDSSKTEIIRVPEIKNKVLIVNISAGFTGMFYESRPWKSPAYVYATAIQNILSNDFLVETTLAQDLLLSIVVLVLLWYFYGRWGAWWGLVATVGTGIVLGVLLVVVFANFDVFVGPASVAVPIAAALVSFFPYEIVTDRRRILEEQTRLTTELHAAREMQMGLMPKEDPVVPGFDIAGICVPANEVGGDFFDYVWLDEKRTRLGIAVADVSGKAMRAAITAVMTSGMIYQEIGNGESPKKLLRKINKPLYMKIDDRMFTALSFGVLDTKKKELRFSNAGQMYPALNRKGRVIMLEVKGARLPLGIKENVLYEEMVVKLKKGDTVVFYTDGIPEAKNEKDEFYGFDRFKSLAGGIEGISARETRDRILEDVKSFTGKTPQYDDMTVVVLQMK